MRAMMEANERALTRQYNKVGIHIHDARLDLLVPLSPSKQQHLPFQVANPRRKFHLTQNIIYENPITTTSLSNQPYPASGPKLSTNSINHAFQPLETPQLHLRSVHILVQRLYKYFSRQMAGFQRRGRASRRKDPLRQERAG